MWEFGSVEGIEIESAKWVGGLTMPVTGTVIEVNEDIEDELELLPEDPYIDAWLILVEPSDLEADLENLIHGDKIKSWFEEDIASRN
jgi:glycine cleavage system H protein